MNTPRMAAVLACVVLASCAAPSRAAAPRAAAPPAAAPPAGARTLRVLTYNIHHGEGADARINLPRIAKVITDTRPDLVALQEVDVKTRRSGGVDQAAELARLTGMHVAFAKAIDYQGGEYGQAILSRTPPGPVQTHALPGRPDAERRIAASTTVRPWGERGPGVLFVGTHLDHVRDDSDRLRQADEINRLFVAPGDEKPAILTGDLNAGPESEVMKRFAAHWHDSAAGAKRAAPTVPAEKPTRRIDYVLLRPKGAWRVIETTVIEEPVASDHRPVLAVLEWRAQAPEAPR